MAKKPLKKTLLIMAAGLGSRYGGLKQMDAVGARAQVLLDYSIYDAKRSGFNKIVFIIRREFAAEFEKKFNNKRFGADLEIHYLYQEIDTLTNGFKPHPHRAKPWGTGHAVLLAKDIINEPFLISNADDFVGLETYRAASAELDHMTHSKKHYFTIGFPLVSMLSKNGDVSRGIMTVRGKNHYLVDIEEHHHVAAHGKTITGTDPDGDTVELSPQALVSANIFGFTPDYFNYAGQYWHEFLTTHAEDETTEFYLPTTVDNLIIYENATITAIESAGQWLGITYKKDKKSVVAAIAELTKAGVYPEKLWVKDNS